MMQLQPVETRCIILVKVPLIVQYRCGGQQRYRTQESFGDLSSQFKL